MIDHILIKSKKYKFVLSADNAFKVIEGFQKNDISQDTSYAKKVIIECIYRGIRDSYPWYYFFLPSKRSISRGMTIRQWKDFQSGLLEEIQGSEEEKKN